MSGPYEPQYPQDPYQPPYQQQPYQQQQQPYQQYPGYPPGQGYPGAPPDVQDRGRLAARLADRLAARPAPRLGISLAGVGVGLAILGVLIWSITYIAEGASGFSSGGGGGTAGGSRHYLGAVLSLAVIVVGYALAVLGERGPLATAGIAASAIGVPVCLEFLTFDLGPSGGRIVNFDAVTWGSVVVWLISYLFVRGTRGHTFYLGLSALLIWDYVVDKATPNLLSGAVSFGGQNFFGSDNLGTPHIDWSTLAGVSLTVGAIYYVLAWALDRTGRSGAGVAFALIGFPAVTLGIIALYPGFKQIGTGIVLIAVGVILAGYGARHGRRFTTWIWAVGAAGGAGLVVGKLLADSSGVAAGIAFIVLGAVFVVVGALLARVLNEPDDVMPGPETT
jgi:hypothetical protein